MADQSKYWHPAGQRLRKGRYQIQAGPSGRRGNYPETGAGSAIAVRHRRGGELVLGQHGRDVVAEEGGVINIFDIRSADAEDVSDAFCRKVLDDEIGNATL